MNRGPESSEWRRWPGTVPICVIITKSTGNMHVHTCDGGLYVSWVHSQLSTRVGLWRRGHPASWPFCQLTAKPGNKTAAPPPPDPYDDINCRLSAPLNNLLHLVDVWHWCYMFTVHRFMGLYVSVKEITISSTNTNSPWSSSCILYENCTYHCMTLTFPCALK